MPKYADPAVYTVGAPASTDLVMTRKADASDGNFALGNLAGIAPVTVANDQALALIGGNWTAYALTAQARTFLAATTQAAQRTALALGDAAVQNIGTSGATVPLLNGTNTWSALQTFSGASYWNFATSIGSIRYGNPGGVPGILGFQGDYTGSAFSRSEIQFRPGVIRFGASAAGGGDVGATQFLEVANSPASARPLVDNNMALGATDRRFTTVWATNSTINTSDARLKTEPRQLRDAEFKAFSAVCRLPPVWRWKNRVYGDENCEPEGRAARKHFGPTVQAAMQVFADNGLDAFENAPFCYDQWEAEPEQWHEWPAKAAVYETIPAVLGEEGEVVEPEQMVLIEPAVEAYRELIQPAREAGDRYSFRKEELLCGMVSALARENDEKDAILNGLLARVAALEAKG